MFGGATGYRFDFESLVTATRGAAGEDEEDEAGEGKGDAYEGGDDREFGAVGEERHAGRGGGFETLEGEDHEGDGQEEASEEGGEENPAGEFHGGPFGRQGAGDYGVSSFTVADSTGRGGGEPMGTVAGRGDFRRNFSRQ